MSTEKKTLSPSEISAFCGELVLIIKAGVPVQEGISIMCEDAHDSRDRAILTGLRAHVEEGRPLAYALRQSGVFPKYTVDMVEIGEAAGRLDEVMESLCEYYEHNEAISRSIKNAISYPATMIGMMAVVILVLVIKVLPIFEQVFRQLGSDMSAFSQGIMDFGRAISRYSVVIVAVLAVIIVAFLVLYFTKGGKKLLLSIYDSFFLTRKFAALVSAGRFASAMSLMLASGLDTDRSLEMAYELTQSQKLRTKLDDLRGQLTAGRSFCDALVAAQVFSGVYTRIIAVGFKTGAVDTVMQKIAQRYEEEIDTRIGTILSILEPTLVAVLSVIVGLILLSVMLPLMGIMSSIG